MKILSVSPLKIEDVKVISFARFADERGYFTETIRVQDLTTIPKIPELHNQTFYQINESLSYKNVVRGLHCQWEPHMGKLVRVLDGSLIDIILDIRTDSKTFGKALLYELVYETKSDSVQWLWIPPGFAHGFAATSQNTRMEYACTGWWNPQCEQGISVYDKNIDWSLNDSKIVDKLNTILANAIINDKDKNAMTLLEWQSSEGMKKFMSTIPKT